MQSCRKKEEWRKKKRKLMRGRKTRKQGNREKESVVEIVGGKVDNWEVDRDGCSGVPIHGAYKCVHAPCENFNYLVRTV